ncbi:MAG: hypothetical protein IKS33_00095 [Bacteroidales bacterium]|nr:hypothetical protein [Bacteroidales bacterium]
MEKYVARFLCSFFQLFQCYLLEIKISDGKVEGVVCYEDFHDIQQFIWNYNHNNSIEDAIALAEILWQEKLINGDKIIVTEEDIKKILHEKKWSEETISNSINFLLNVRVNMIDNGEVTDSFFVHF